MLGSYMTGHDDSQFYETVPSFERFAGVADPANYAPLPDSWSIATADIVNSTKAIEQGKYKAVNMAGASVIAAIINERLAYRIRRPHIGRQHHFASAL